MIAQAVFLPEHGWMDRHTDTQTNSQTELIILPMPQLMPVWVTIKYNNWALFAK